MGSCLCLQAVWKSERQSPTRAASAGGDVITLLHVGTQIRPLGGCTYCSLGRILARPRSFKASPSSVSADATSRPQSC